MSPSAKGTHHVSEFSNKNFDHNRHIKTVNVLETPVSVGGGTETPNGPEKRSKKKGLIIGAAGLALAIAAGTGIGFAVSANGEKPPTATESSAPVDPSEENPETPANPSTPEAAYDTEAGFSTEVYTTPEALAEAGIEMSTQWFNDGANAETTEEAFAISNPLSIEDFSAQLAAETDQNYINSVLVSGWESNPNLVGFVNNMTNNHKNTLNLYFITSNFSGQFPEDVEPYRREAHLISVESTTVNPDGSWTIVTIENESDNDDRNRANELTGDTAINDPFEVPSRISQTWVVQDGRWVISQIQNLGDA